MPWIREKADRVIDRAAQVTVDTEAAETDDSRERAALELVRGTIGEPAYLDAVARLDGAAEARGQRARIVHDVPPPVDWERWSTEDINTVLRVRFAHIELGLDLLPIRAEWRYPEWRRA